MTGTRPVPPPGRYIVFGATGLAGSHVLSRLKDVSGIEVSAVGNRRPPNVHGGNIEYVRADLSDPERVAGLADGARYALMLAGVLATAPALARDPVGPVLANLRIATNCLEEAYRSGVEKCVWLSSTTGYPDADEALAEDRMFDGEPPAGWVGIGWTTRYIERLGRMFAEDLPRRMTMIALRPTMMYGEFDHFDEDTAHFLPSLIRRVVARETPIEVWGDGTQTRDTVYAGDVADAILAVTAQVAGFDCFNIAEGRSHTINEVLDTILELDGYSDARILHVEGRPSSVARRRFATEKAATVAGVSPQTPLKAGLQRTIKWYRETYAA